MRWKNSKNWRKHIAWWPLRLGNTTIWLERYAVRYVKAIDKRDQNPDAIIFVYELSHPDLGLYERQDRWWDCGLAYDKGGWLPKLAEI